MTEAGPVLAMCLGFAKYPFPTKTGSCGTVVRNAELKVIHPLTALSLPPNHPGEICIRGQQIMKGTYILYLYLFKDLIFIILYSFKIFFLFSIIYILIHFSYL